MLVQDSACVPPQVKTAGTADDGEGKVCCGKQGFRFFDAGAHQIVDRRNAVHVGKCMHQIIFVDMRKLRQLLQRNILTAVCVDIAPDRFTQVRGSFIGWRQDGLKVCLYND